MGPITKNTAMINILLKLFIQCELVLRLLTQHTQIDTHVHYELLSGIPSALLRLMFTVRTQCLRVL